MPGKHCCCVSGKVSDVNEAIVSSEINSPLTDDSSETADTNQRKKKDEEDNEKTNRREKRGKDKKKGKDKKGKDKKKEDYNKKLKIEIIGIDVIDRLFTNLTSVINKFVIIREKLQQAKESFMKFMKTISEFDGQKGVKACIKELKEKAKQGNITIYIDGCIKVKSTKGVDPPTLYSDAVKALNNMKDAVAEMLSLQPTIQRAIEACIQDITDIDPERELRKMVSGVKALVTLPKKIKKFNDNRKEVQRAPKIVQEFCVYVKQLVCDIIDAFRENEKDEGGSKDAKGGSKNAKGGGKDAKGGGKNAKGGGKNAKGGGKNAKGGGKDAKGGGKDAEDDGKDAEDDGNDDENDVKDDEDDGKDAEGGRKDAKGGGNDDEEDVNDAEDDGKDAEDDGNDDENDGKDDEEDGNDDEDDGNDVEDDGNDDEDDGNDDEDDGNDDEDDGNDD